MRENLNGRLELVKELARTKKFSLSVGSKETRLADINLDINPNCQPDIVGDVRSLPFQSEIFERVFFTEVIEHLSRGDELQALKEIYRVLKKGGELILSTPNHRFFFTYLDPAFWLINHHHYKKEAIEKLVRQANFKIVKIFTAGGSWNCLGCLWYCLITFPLKKILGRNFSYTPAFLQTRADKEYQLSREGGYIIFLKAKKE